MAYQINVKKKIKDPVKFLISQIKIDVDALDLIRQFREDFKWSSLRGDHKNVVLIERSEF